MLVGSPIVGHPCYFGVDMQTREELVGGKITKDDICKKSARTVSTIFRSNVLKQPAEAAVSARRASTGIIPTA